MISVARVIAPFIANDNSFSRVLSHIIYIYQLLEILSKLAEQNLNKKREHTFSPAYFAIVKLRKVRFKSIEWASHCFTGDPLDLNKRNPPENG